MVSTGSHRRLKKAACGQRVGHHCSRIANIYYGFETLSQSTFCKYIRTNMEVANTTDNIIELKKIFSTVI